MLFMSERETESLFWQLSIQLKWWTTRYVSLHPTRMCELASKCENKKQWKETRYCLYEGKQRKKKGFIVWIITLNFVSSIWLYIIYICMVCMACLLLLTDLLLLMHFSIYRYVCMWLQTNRKKEREWERKKCHNNCAN